MIPLFGSEGWDRNLEDDDMKQSSAYHCPTCGWRLGDGDRVTGKCPRCMLTQRRLR